MTIDQAVEILNKHRWRERGDWLIQNADKQIVFSRNQALGASVLYGFDVVLAVAVSLEAQVQERDYLCLPHVAGAMVEGVDCIACFERMRMEESEASLCPEDVGIAEYVHTLERQAATHRYEAFAAAAQVALSIRKQRCGCAHCESTATEIASLIQGRQLAEEIRANTGLGDDASPYSEAEDMAFDHVGKRIYPPD